MSQLRSLNRLVPPLFFHSTKSGSFFLRCQGSPDVKGGGGAERGEIKKTYSATTSNVTLGERYKDIDD